MSFAPFIAIDQAVLNVVKKEIPHINHAEQQAVRNWILGAQSGVAHRSFSGYPTVVNVEQSIAEYTKLAEGALATIKGVPEKIREAIQHGTSTATKGLIP